MTRLERVTPVDHPSPVGYAHAIKASGVLFISGQCGIDADRKLVGPGDVAAQTWKVLENLDNVLRSGGSSWADVVKVNIYLTDIRSMGRVREVRAEFYAGQGVEAPATTTVGVTGLSIEGALIEIEAIAVLP